MKNYLLICFLFSLIFCGGCNKTKVSYSYYPDGKKSSEYIDNGNTSIRNDYYPSGHILNTTTYINGLTESSKAFYETGELMQEIPYQNGLANGTAYTYYKNGMLLAITKLQNDRRISEIILRKSGMIFSKTEYDGWYNQNFKYGVCDIFGEDGKVIATGIFKCNMPWEGTFLSSVNNKVIDAETAYYILEYKNGILVNMTVLSVPVLNIGIHEKQK